ncbi:helix-turn-helix domain-containing protein [Streptomyces nanshensis]|uniref:XRE family transcriptional regulator n=1 Tax=Streptomyces nanshensis TaxID=518642 RepID=A0A1E7LC14_9ACTN|nr:helix-turn-helix transcriptional regulator [Streptomyces nanshensis]OEV13747.1 XRE family transcriptional regulator [Streptomyces nanshensis]
MDTQGIGRRIAYWRGRRRMSQQDFGRLMGQSRRWVQDLEGGKRQTDPRLSVLESAARVLSIRLQTLLADASGVERVDAAELEAIRAVLHSHDLITGTSTGDAEPPPVEVLRSRVAYGWTAFQRSHFSRLGRLIPELLSDANGAAARHHGENQLDAFRALSMALQLTEAVSIKFAAYDLAAAAGHRAVTAAERSGDPVIMASAARHLADAMTHSGQAHAAARFAVAAAERLDPELKTRGASGLSTLGMLYLKAAMAQASAAVCDDATAPADAARAVPHLLNQAEEHADELGADGNALWTAYGPTNVSLYRVAAHVQLSEGADAAAVAARIPDHARAALPCERRAHHLADLARGLTQAGRRVEAVDTLLDAEREATEEIRSRPRTHQLIEDLRLLGAGSAQGRLRELAGRCGLPQ